MSEYAGQDNGTLRVTIREAASRLGVTEAAIRKRIQRGSLDKELGEDGRVYVYLDLYQNMSHPKSQVDHEALVEELRDRVRFLERELDRRSVEAERYQHIVAGLATANANLTDRLKERSEEHTSELQSRQYLVCRLLLEKKTNDRDGE